MVLLEIGTIEVAAIITALIILFSKRLSNFIFNTLVKKPVLKIADAVYRFIAPRNPFSISLRSYKRHIRRSSLARMENPVGPAVQVPLEHAYAPLKLLTGVTHESIDLFDYTASETRYIVLGGPGTGKTTIMKSLLMNIINEKTKAELNKLVPVFVVLREMVKNKHSVQQAITNSFI